MLGQDDAHINDIRVIGQIGEVPLILEACRAMTGMGFTAVARVTSSRWVTCASLDHLNFGLQPGDELEVESTICHEVRSCRQTIAIPDVDASEVYRDHRTPRQYGFKSYISVPIFRTDGAFWGTLCAIDPVPRRMTPQVVTTFELFARLISLQLDRQDELDRSQTELASERDTARLREEFIAIVGHDLRNPIAAVSAGLAMLSRGQPGERGALLIPEMQRALGRAGQILANLLDFARGRLGVGIELAAHQPVDLEPVFRSVIHEIAQIAEQPLQVSIDLPRPIRADPQRLGQLLSNLLGNAVTHGRQGTPVVVEAAEVDGMLRVAVTNQGAAIPDEVRATMFLPFSRGPGVGTGPQGLGLGLYISAEIAKAHGGSIEVDSNEHATTFTLLMPAQAE